MSYELQRLSFRDFTLQAIRTELGIEKDLFGLLGGRETYVVDSSGSVVNVFNSQFKPDDHVTTAIAAVEAMPQPTSPLDAITESLAGLFDSFKQ
jgi:hypothetical protein